MKQGKISNNVIRRLPRYLRKLDELLAKGEERISSSELGSQLGLTSSQIRQDFSCFGGFGQQGYGYNVASLREAIAGILGLDKGHKAILVGAGNIGRALMCNFSFENWGFRLCSAFDTCADRVGEDYHGVKVRHMDELETYLEDNRIDVAVLTVPKDAAETVTKRLVSCGIRAIWNFTNVEIEAPNSDTIIEHMHFSDSLLSLSYYISRSEDDTE